MDPFQGEFLVISSSSAVPRYEGHSHTLGVLLLGSVYVIVDMASIHVPLFTSSWAHQCQVDVCLYWSLFEPHVSAGSPGHPPEASLPTKILLRGTMLPMSFSVKQWESIWLRIKTRYDHEEKGHTWSLLHTFRKKTDCWIKLIYPATLPTTMFHHRIALCDYVRVYLFMILPILPLVCFPSLQILSPMLSPPILREPLMESLALDITWDYLDLIIKQYIVEFFIFTNLKISDTPREILPWNTLKEFVTQRAQRSFQVMWVDQPAGVGFSTGIGTHNEQGVANNMFVSLGAWYSVASREWVQTSQDNLINLHMSTVWGHMHRESEMFIEMYVIVPINRFTYVQFIYI